MLSLQLAFPGGRYRAADHADPRWPEWPPHPSRIYSALVAAAHAGARKPSTAEREALVWLESAGAPSLAFPAADVQADADAFVPVNDVKSRIDARKGQSLGVLLPNRQPRQFPAAFLLGEPELRYVWPAESPADILATLDALAARLTHVGTSHSFAMARFVDEPMALDAKTIILVPSEDGRIHLRVPCPGRLVELDRLAVQGYGTLRRPPSACEALVGYGRPNQDPVLPVQGDREWLALRWRGATWGADTGHTLARAFRAAMMSLLGDEAPACIHGHDASIRHAAWLPLPDVGHAHARGRLRGIALALPHAVGLDDRSLVLGALAQLHRVNLPDGQCAEILPVVEGADTPQVLRREVWCRPDTDWSTVTPVLLDRPPKRAEPARIEAAIQESLMLAGYPRPEWLRFSSQSDFSGAPHVHAIPTRVPRFHVRLRFAQPVSGPVLAGRWRHFGIGLFRPTPVELRGSDDGLTVPA